MRFQPKILLLLAAVICFSRAPSATAQGFGTIVGTVTDPSGSVIPAVKITVVNEGTQATRAVTTNDQGYYVVPALQPSTYDVSASASGFAGFTHKGVTVLA